MKNKEIPAMLCKNRIPAMLYKNRIPAMLYKNRIPAMLKKLILAVMVMFVSAGISCAVGVGTTGAQFLKIDPTAKSMAMGGAYSAVSDDSAAVFYNPAGIARLESREISGTFLRYFQAINYGSISGVVPRDGEGVFGFGINYLGVTDIQRRGLDDEDDPDGTRSVSTFGAMDTAVSIAYAKKNMVPSILKDMDIGLNLKFIYQTIDEDSAFSAMVDVGAFYSANDKLSLALTISNIGMNVKFKNESDPLPLSIKTGASYKVLPELLIACDLTNYIIDEMFYASLGAEYWIKNIVALRAGYKYGYDIDSLGSVVGLSGGMGLKLYNMGLDYAFAPFGELGDTHRVTFSVKF